MYPFSPRKQVAPPDPKAAGEIYVTAMQNDARLLMRYVARRPTRALPVQIGQDDKRTSIAFPAALTADPKVVAADPAAVRDLADFIDQLSRQAAPASVSTIRFTSAFLRSSIDATEPPPEVSREVWFLRWMTYLTLSSLVVVLAASLLLLAHVDSGRRVLQQLDQSRAEIRQIYAEIADAPQAEGNPADRTAAARPLPLCRPSRDTADPPAGGTPPTWREPATPREGMLCGRLRDAQLRNDLIYATLTQWNCITYTIGQFGLNLVSGPLCGPLPPGFGREGTDDPKNPWYSTEIRTTTGMAVLGGFTLPLLLGFVGGCTYVLRNLDKRVEEWLLEPRDAMHLVVRVILAATLGGLAGILWSPDDGVRLSGFTLSLSALAFFIGFSVEIVFSVVETMVEAVAGKLRSPTPPAAVNQGAVNRQ